MVSGSEQVLQCFLYIGIAETKEQLIKSVPAGDDFPLIPGARQSWTERVGKQIDLLGLSMSRFLAANIDDVHTKEVLRGSFLFIRRVRYSHLSKTVRNLCSLLDSGFEPVLILSGFHVMQEQGEGKSTIVDPVALTRIHMTISTAKSELDFSDIAGAPVEMFTEIMRSRFQESMKTL